MRYVTILLVFCLALGAYASKPEQVREWSLSEVVSESDLIIIAELNDYYLTDQKGNINRDPERIAFMSTPDSLLVTEFCISEVVYGYYKDDCFNIEGALFLGTYLGSLKKYQNAELLVFIKNNGSELRLTTISGAIRNIDELEALISLLEIKKRDTVK